MKIEQQPAFILHIRPFKNTSKIIEILTKDYGRIAVIAKGVSSQKSHLFGILQPFRPLLIDFLGKSELKILTRTEQAYKQFNLKGLSSYCGFYLNELLLKLLPKEVPHHLIFTAYQHTLSRLVTNKKISCALRYFEYTLLQDIGLGFDLKQDCQGLAINPNKYYIFINGWVVNNSNDGIIGICLLNFANFEKNYQKISKECLQQLKHLLFTQINHALSGKPLKSRDLMHDYLQLQSFGKH